MPSGTIRIYNISYLHEKGEGRSHPVITLTFDLLVYLFIKLYA